MSGGLYFGHKGVGPETASSRSEAPGTMTCQHAQESLSGFLEDGLPPSALAMNTEARLRKYLLTDPFHQEA
jgi:hypothetical protein